jgi:hypothetical protein
MDASSISNPDLSTAAADPAPLSTEAEPVAPSSLLAALIEQGAEVARLRAELKNNANMYDSLGSRLGSLARERDDLATQLQAATKASATLGSNFQLAANKILLLQADNRAIRLMYDALSPVPLCGALENYNKTGLMITADNVAELPAEELREALVRQLELMRSMVAMHKHLADELDMAKKIAAEHNEAISALKSTHAMHLSQDWDNHVEALAKQQRFDNDARNELERRHRIEIHSKDRELEKARQLANKADKYKVQRNGLRGDLFAAKAELAAAKAELASTKAKMDEQARGSSITMALLEARTKLEQQQKRTAEQGDDDEPVVSASKRRAAADDDDDEPAMSSPSKRPAADDEESD